MKWFQIPSWKTLFVIFAIELLAVPPIAVFWNTLPTASHGRVGDANFAPGMLPDNSNSVAVQPVKPYAKGNGTTDDAPGINTAISNIRSTTPTNTPFAKALQFQAGTYLVQSAPINLTCLSNNDPANCGGTSVNQQFVVDGNGATILCETTGTPCIDGLGSRYLLIKNLTIRGICNSNEPSIGLQIGRTSSNITADKNILQNVTFEGCFTRGGYVNLASEDTLVTGTTFLNSDATTNAIAASLSSGVLTVTSAAANTLGAGSIIADSGINIPSGTVVYITGQTSGTSGGVGVYTVNNDTLAVSSESMIASGGINGAHAVILDGGNHWNLTSPYVTESIPQDTAQSFNGNTFIGSQIVAGGTGSTSGGLWLSGTRDLRLPEYINTETIACIDIYNDSSGAANATLQNFDGSRQHCEPSTNNNLQSIVFFASKNAATTITTSDLKLSDPSSGVADSILAADTNTTGVTLIKERIRIDNIGHTPSVFNTRAGTTWTITDPDDDYFPSGIANWVFTVGNTCTNIGSAGSCTLRNGQLGRGIIELNTGSSSVGSSGSATITLPSNVKLGVSFGECQFSIANANTTNVWGNAAKVTNNLLLSEVGGTYTAQWANYAPVSNVATLTALIASTQYNISYQCRGSHS